VFFLKRIGIALFSTRRAFRRYKVAGFNRGYFSSSDSFVSNGIHSISRVVVLRSIFAS
jgi:hypothetical protein